MVLSAKIKMIINVVVLAILIGSCIGVTCWVAHRKNKELRRLKANYAAEVMQDRSVQQTIDLRDFKEYFTKEIELLKNNGVPARNVEHIVEVSYVYRDTTIYRDTLVYIYDTLKASRSAEFCVQTACHDIEGVIVGDTIEVRSVTAYDDILVALYREKRKCLFGRQKVRAIAISSCTGDTLGIKRNLKIEK